MNSVCWHCELIFDYELWMVVAVLKFLLSQLPIVAIKQVVNYLSGTKEGETQKMVS